MDDFTTMFASKLSFHHAGSSTRNSEKSDKMHKERWFSAYTTIPLTAPLDSLVRTPPFSPNAWMKHLSFPERPIFNSTTETANTAVWPSNSGSNDSRKDLSKPRKVAPFPRRVPASSQSPYTRSFASRESQSRASSFDSISSMQSRSSSTSSISSSGPKTPPPAFSPPLQDKQNFVYTEEDDVLSRLLKESQDTLFDHSIPPNLDIFNDSIFNELASILTYDSTSLSVIPPSSYMQAINVG
jgi:hypothetical protein